MIGMLVGVAIVGVKMMVDEVQPMILRVAVGVEEVVEVVVAVAVAVGCRWVEPLIPTWPQQNGSSSRSSNNNT